MYPTERNQANHQFFFFNATATTEIYTLSLHDALPISGDTKGQGSDIKGPGDEGLPPRTSRPLDLSRPELATPEGGVAALLGGGKSVAWPDWKQMQIVPGGISANDLELNLNGQFINRGQLEVTNNL